MAEYIPFYQGEKRSDTDKLAKYFEYSDLETKTHYDEEKDVYILSVPSNKEKEAKKHYQAFYFVERDRIDNEDIEDDYLEEFEKGNILTEPSLDEIASSSDSDSTSNQAFESETLFTDDAKKADNELNLEEDILSDEESEEISIDPQKSLLSGSGSYIMKSEQYKDYTGTLYIFLILGVSGIIFVILNIAKVFTLLNGFFPNLIMGALFIYFIYEALSTGKKAKKLKSEMEEENQLTEKINQWLINNITEEFIESISNPDLSDELDYIKKTDRIRDMLISEFGEINRDYLDILIENFYSDKFDTVEIYTEDE